MIIAPTDISAKAGSGNGKPGMLRALVLSMMLAGAAASGASAAGLGDRDQRDPRDGRGDQRDQRDRPPPQQQPAQPQQAPRDVPQQRGGARQFDTRDYDMRLDEARRQQAQQQQQDNGARRGGRLTPDERRELRRQINEAGVDLYPNTPRR